MWKPLRELWGFISRSQALDWWTKKPILPIVHGKSGGRYKRTTRRDVVQHCDAYKDKDRKALRAMRSLEGKGLLESKAETTENGTEIAFKPTE